MQKSFLTIRTSSDKMSRFIEENLSAKALSFSELPGGQVHIGNPTWFMSRLDRAGYNGVTMARFTSDDLDQQIEKCLEPFRKNNTPLTWWVGPLSEPGNLGQALQKHGFHYLRNMQGMAVDLGELEKVGLSDLEYTFEPVRSRENLETWLPLFMETFGIPARDGSLLFDIFSRLSFLTNSAWRHYYMRIEDKVVATSTLFLSGNVAGLYNIAVHPDYRRLGLGSTITQLTFEQAKQLGYSLGTLQTTYPNALRMYHQLGFEVYCKFETYQRSWN